jgi:pyruvate dehydrogenase E1 component alpha subunit
MRGLSRGEFPGFYFPVRGMEAAAVGVIAALRPDDYYVTTYRGIADVLAKGASLEAVFGELLGRVTGMSRGKGGTMHMADPERGMMLTTGIVGSGTPIANGLGLASQLLGDGRVTGVSFGDGATSIGALHEALNLARCGIFRSSSSATTTSGRNAPRSTRTPGPRGSPTGPARSGCPGVTVDGTDVLQVYDAAAQAADRARAWRRSHVPRGRVAPDPRAQLRRRRRLHGRGRGRAGRARTIRCRSSASGWSRRGHLGRDDLEADDPADSPARWSARWPPR